MRPSLESSFCKGDEKDALLGGASSGTRHTGRAREYRPKKNLDAGAPLGGWRRHRQASEERILGLAGPDFDPARLEGRELTLDEAVALALG